MANALPLSDASRIALNGLFRDMLDRVELSQVEAAEKIGVCPATVCQWLLDRSKPNARDIPFEALLWGMRRCRPADQARLIERAAEIFLRLRVRVELPAELAEAPDPIALVGDLSERSSRAIRSILGAIADRRIDEVEDADLERHERALRDLAEEIRALRSRGRRGAL